MKFVQYKSVLLLLCIVLLGAFLRLYRIDVNPPGLYIDEVAIGYNAYTILQKGVDEYGIATPLWFRSFDDYKMPVYIYTTALSMAIFGKTELAIRMPSAIAGIGSIIALFFIVRMALILQKEEQKELKALPFLSAFLLAVSPWAIQFSRAGFEVNLALFLFLCGTLFYLSFLRKRYALYLLLSVFFIILSSYTYHSFRIITPIVLLIGFYQLYKEKYASKTTIGVTGLFSLLLLLPIILFSLTANGSERFAATSTFAEYEAKTLIEKFVTYPLVLIKNYASYFSFHFLFNFGDGFGRHQLPQFGVFAKWQLSCLLIGIYYLLRTKKQLLSKCIITLLLLAPIPAMLARPSPHSLRSLLLVVPLTILTALGILFLKRYARSWNVLIGGIVLLAMYEFVLYLHHYYVHYPKVNLADWGAGYKELVLETEKLSTRYSTIYVDNAFGFAPIYFHFYSDTVSFQMADTSRISQENANKNTTLLIRPYYGNEYEKNVVKTIYLPNANHDIYAQLRTLE